jgi:hypothetical protein
MGGARWAEVPPWANEMPAEDALWAQPATAGGAPWDDDPLWAQQTGTAAPSRDDDAYWGQPPPPWEGDAPRGQDADWSADAAGPQSWAGGAPGPQPWAAEGTGPMPLMDPAGPGLEGLADPWDPTGRTTMPPGAWSGGPVQPGPVQPGSGQPGTGQMGPGQPGTGQMSPGQPGSGQLGTGQMGTGQMGPGRLGTGQMHTEQMVLDGIPPGPRRRFWVPAVAIVVAVALVVAIVAVTRHHGPGTAAGSPDATPTAGGGGTLGSSTAATPGSRTDPISAANIFPQTQVSIDGLPFTQVTSSTVTSCSSAANGAFAAALVTAGCKRVVRATYVDASKKYAVTAGVAALPTYDDALKADSSKQFGPDVWFTALDGASGSGAGAIAQTVGVGCDVVDSRFIVFALSAYSNGQNPTGHTSDIQTLTGLSQSFISLVEQPLTSGGKS